MKSPIRLLPLILVMALARPLSARGAAPASAPSFSEPANLDHALANPMTLDAAHRPLSEVADTLRSLTHTNIVLNWNALSKSGITRDTPVDLHVQDLPFEQVVKTLTDTLAVSGSAANYSVSDNILTITTDAELGKANVPAIFDLARAVSYSLDKTSGPEQQAANGKILEGVFRKALANAGEPMDARGHALAVKGAALAATLSPRGSDILEKALRQLNGPTRPGQFAPGTQLTAAAKKTAALFAGIRNPSLADIALHAADHPQGLNIALLPGALDPATQKPADALSSTITDGGVLLIGPRAAVHARGVLGVYDVRDLIKRMIAKSPQKPPAAPADVQNTIVHSLEAAVPLTDNPADKPTAADIWGTLAGAPSSITPYNGLLIIFTTPERHRQITAALQKMNP